MKLTMRALAIAIVLAVAGNDPQTSPVFEKMLAVNRGLASYTAHIEVQTRVLFGHFTLCGTVYERGTRSAVVFDRVPSIAKAAVDDVPSIEGPAAWPERYAISFGARTPDSTTFHLVPLAAGEVRSVDAVVSNDSGLVQEYVWTKASGMTITSDLTYESVGGYELVASSVTKVRGIGLPATSTTTFSNYALNVAVPDTLLASES